MNDGRSIADDYIAIWNETDGDLRAKAVAALWADDADYVDPMVAVRGHEAISGTVAAVQQQFPGWRFRLTGTPDAHHDLVRFTWELGPDGGEAPVAGFDVAVLGEDGRIKAVHGFLDRVPA